MIEKNTQNKIIINKVCRWQGDSRRARSKSAQSTLNHLANCKKNQYAPWRNIVIQPGMKSANHTVRPPPLPWATQNGGYYRPVGKSPCSLVATKPSADLTSTERSFKEEWRGYPACAFGKGIQLLQEYTDSPGGKSSSRKLVNCKGFKEQQEWWKH